MDYIKKLEKDLLEYMVKDKEDLQIKGWYFGINSSTSLKIGMKNNELGGPYSCPKAEDSIRGKIYIIWKDNRRSVASLESNTLNNIPRMMVYWRRASYMDEGAPDIYVDSQYPDVKLYDEEVHKMIDEDQDSLYDYLSNYKSQLLEGGLRNITATASASYFDHYIRNSQGLKIENRATSFSTSLYADETYGKSYISRRKLMKDRSQSFINQIASTVLSLRKKGTIEGGPMKILLMPEVTEAFILHYLLRNLQGSSVHNKRSAFLQGDFDEGKKVMAENLNLYLNTIEDYNQGSYISTYEGVAGGEIHLIKDGQLNSPILDLKYANKMNKKATPLPAGQGSLKFYGKKKENYQDTIDGMDKGIIICNLLGMHTQDATSGNYSLTAPNCMILEKGKIVGGCKAVISGNFFEALKDQETAIVELKGSEEPMLLMKSKITVD
ncbi:metallopeptidase TldD-related protein [Alkaliphilus serpentinus]|nr:metallopeptidase TldD-related protein [Alkaliphilus serpentinus]